VSFANPIVNVSAFIHGAVHLFAAPAKAKLKKQKTDDVH
jgi:hypothetical protein